MSTQVSTTYFATNFDAPSFSTALQRRGSSSFANDLHLRFCENAHPEFTVGPLGGCFSTLPRGLYSVPYLSLSRFMVLKASRSATAKSQVGKNASLVKSLTSIFNDLLSFQFRSLRLGEAGVHTHQVRRKSFRFQFLNNIQPEQVSRRFSRAGIQVLARTLAFPFPYVKRLICPWVNQCVDIKIQIHTTEEQN